MSGSLELGRRRLETTDGREIEITLLWNASERRLALDPACSPLEERVQVGPSFWLEEIDEEQGGPWLADDGTLQLYWHTFTGEPGSLRRYEEDVHLSAEAVRTLVAWVHGQQRSWLRPGRRGRESSLAGRLQLAAA